jgi:hypothetical protein
VRAQKEDADRISVRSSRTGTDFGTQNAFSTALAVID